MKQQTLAVRYAMLLSAVAMIAPSLGAGARDRPV